MKPEIKLLPLLAGLASFAGLPSTAFAISDIDSSSTTKAVNVRIIGGKEARIEQYPFMTGLVETGNSAADAFCGASVIAPNWILTAAHCLEGYQANGLEVITGTADLNNLDQAQRVAVTQIVSHPEYNNSTLINDIALLRLDKNVNAAFITTADNSTRNFFAEGSSVSVAGWGNRSQTGQDFPTKLHAVDLKISNFPACSSAYDGLQGSQICATASGGKKDSCQGDSGGPLIARTDKGPIQVGIVSFGDECASATHPGVYTKVSSYSSFIKRTTGTDTSLIAGEGASTEVVTTSPVSANNSQPVTLELGETTVENANQVPEEQNYDSELTEQTSVEQSTFSTEIEAEWFETFSSVPVNDQSEAALEIYNSGENSFVISNIAITANANLSIDSENCTAAELQSHETCYVDLTWSPDSAESLQGSISFAVFDGSINQDYSLPYSADTLKEIDFPDSLDLDTMDFYTDNQNEWNLEQSETMTGDSALSSDMLDTDSLTLLGEFDFEEDYELSFNYQMEGVTCFLYIDDEAWYELAASNDWQEASISVPAGSNVRWDFRSLGRSSMKRKIMLDGLRVRSTAPTSTTAANGTQNALSVDTQNETTTSQGFEQTSGGSGSGGPLALAGLLAALFWRKQGAKYGHGQKK